MQNKIISMLLMTSMIATSCGSKKEGANEVVSGQNQIKNENNKISPKKEMDPVFKAWLTLVTHEEKNNLALAHVISSYVRNKSKEDALIFIEENLDDTEIEKIIKNVNNQFDQKELDQLFLGYTDDRDAFYEKSLYFSLKSEIKGKLEKQLFLETISVVRTKYLEEINRTYENALAENIKEIAPKIQKELVESLPNEARNIENEILNGEKENAIVKLKNALIKLEGIKIIKQEAGLSDTDMIVGTLAGLVAYEIYQSVKDSRTIRNVKMIIEDVKVFQQKIKTAGVLLREIKKINKDSAVEYEKIKIATKDLKLNSKDLIEQIKKDLNNNPEKDFSFTEKIKALNNSLFKKKSFKDNSKLGTYQKKVESVIADVASINGSIASINSNFNATLQTFEKITQTLGIPLGKDAQKILKSARKVSNMVNMATSITSGFLSGGPIGAMSALSGVIGGTSSDAALGEISSRLSEIDRKLDEVIALQKQMIELQFETMKMIRDLSLLVDELHQKEMIKLHELRNDVLVNIEMTKALLNREIRSCENIVFNHMIKVNKPDSLERLFDYSADASIVQMTHKEFYTEFKNAKGLSKIFLGDNSNFEICQYAMSNVFGMRTLNENPTVAIYNSGEENTLLFYKNKYLPLAKKFQTLKRTNLINLARLHLPVKKIKDLNSITFSNGLSSSIDFDTYFDMNKLISSNALIRYNNSLLILYPLLDYQLPVIHSGIEAMITDFFNDLESDSKSLTYLKNSLFLINNAIAQENLMSGSLLLEDLSTELPKLFSKTQECSTSVASYECAIFNNKIILQNLVNYLSLKADSYHPALVAKNVAEMENALGMGTDVFKGKVLINGDKMFLRFSYKMKSAENSSEEIIRDIELKSLIELRKSDVVYSENMEKLVKLQAKIIEAINSVSPHFLDREMSKKYASLILLKAI